MTEIKSLCAMDDVETHFPSLQNLAGQPEFASPLGRMLLRQATTTVAYEGRLHGFKQSRVRRAAAVRWLNTIVDAAVADAVASIEQLGGTTARVNATYFGAMARYAARYGMDGTALGLVEPLAEALERQRELRAAA